MPNSDDGSPWQTLDGRISAKLPRTLDGNIVYDLHGYGGARPGTSGGPVFTRYYQAGKIVLLGIVVGDPAITQDTKMGVLISSSYVKIISSVLLSKINDLAPWSFKF